MKKKILYAIIFLCVPVAILITTAIRRESMYQGKPATVWAEQIRMDRGAALIALQHMGKGALPALREMLNGRSPTERCRAAWAMGRLEPAAAHAAVPDLIQNMDDGNIVLQTEVLHSLSHIGITNENIVPELTAKLSEDYISSYAAELLLSIEQARKAEHLPPIPVDEFDYDMAFAKSPKPGVRIHGAAKLSKLALTDERAKAALQTLLHDENGWVRQESAVAMTNPAAALSSFRLIVE